MTTATLTTLVPMPSVTAGDDEEGEDGAVFDSTGMGLAEGGDLYQQAIAIVIELRKIDHPGISAM